MDSLPRKPLQVFWRRRGEVLHNPSLGSSGITTLCTSSQPYAATSPFFRATGAHDEVLPPALKANGMVLPRLQMAPALKNIVDIYHYFTIISQFSLLTTHYSLFTIHFSLFTIHYSLFTV